MTTFNPRDPLWEERIRSSFAKQGFMAHLGVTIGHLAPGEVDLVVPFRSELTQQHGYFHAGATATIADSASGYAALSLFPTESGVLTTEFKINLINPAQGEQLIARGRVIKSGRTLTVCQSDVFGVTNGAEAHVATALLTMIT